jgi:hypothetical protein
MEKVIRDGKVAVLYSPGYGGGWSSWNHRPELVFHPRLVQWVEDGKKEDIKLLVKEIFGQDTYICTTGAENLEIQWIPQGTIFEITVFDGYEEIRYLNEPNSMVFQA